MKNKKGFTLIELLAVIAIIGLLAGFLTVTVGGARVSALKSKTRTQFGNWGAAIDMFKAEYGYYPANISTGNRIQTKEFLAELTARTYEGTDATPSHNKKKISFYTISDADLLKAVDGSVEETLVDAFENSDIAIFFAEVDGIAKPTAAKLKVGAGANIRAGQYSPTVENVRAGVVFYSAGKGSSAADYVYSWK